MVVYKIVIVQGCAELSNVIEMPGGLSDYEKLFAVVDFLENRDVLINEFKPEVAKYLVKDSFFRGPFKRKYNEMFDDLIISLIKRQITQHFPNFTPEEILLLCDKEFLKMITGDFYFNKSNYTIKDGKNEQ